jgi:ABC-2 type transport system ATP-binding protein
VLRARAVTYSYGPEAPGVVVGDLEVSPGEVLGLVGPNGAGKSTLLRLLEGRLTPDGGTIESPPRRTVDGRVAFGYLAESVAHFESLTGLYNATFFARAGGMTLPQAESAVGELMVAFGMSRDMRRTVGGYSFGARRKLALVEALAHRPDVLLLDEPTVGLDAESREALTRLLRQRAADDLATVLASHDLPFVTEVADRVAFMNRGRVLEGGRPAALLSDLGDMVRFEFSLSEPLAAPPEWPEGLRLLEAGNPLLVGSDRGREDLPEAVGALVSCGARIQSVVVREAGLAEVFRRIAGEELGGHSVDAAEGGTWRG